MIKRNLLVLGLSISLLLGGCAKQEVQEINKPSTTIQIEESTNNLVNKTEVLDLFKDVCIDKPRQDLKLDFLENQLDKIEKVTNLFDNNFKDKSLITTELSENVGPSWEWKITSIPYAVHELNTENSFAGVRLKLITNDDTNEVASAFEGVVVLNSNYMKDITLSDNCYQIIDTLYPGKDKGFWQDSINKCYEDGKTITIESTDKSLIYLYKLDSEVYVYCIENTGY